MGEDHRWVRTALEAVLFVVDEPVDANRLAQVLEVATDEVEAALRALRAEYVDDRRGFVLREVAGGWRMYTNPEAAEHVERFLIDGREPRLSQAALETLAVVAYRQPVTRAEIAEIRGVDADGAVRSLLAHGLVEEVGEADQPGRPRLYGTTGELLERLGLRSIDELPPLAEVDPGGPAPPEPPLGGHREARRLLDADPSPGGDDPS